MAWWWNSLPSWDASWVGSGVQSWWQPEGQQEQEQQEPPGALQDTRRRRWQDVGQPSESATGLKAVRRDAAEPPSWFETLVLSWPGSLATTVPESGSEWDKLALEQFAEMHGCEVSIRHRGVRHRKPFERFIERGGANPGQFQGNRGYRLTVIGSRSQSR